MSDLKRKRNQRWQLPTNLETEDPTARAFLTRVNKAHLQALEEMGVSLSHMGIPVGKALTYRLLPMLNDRFLRWALSRTTALQQSSTEMAEAEHDA